MEDKSKAPGWPGADTGAQRTRLDDFNSKIDSKSYVTTNCIYKDGKYHKMALIGFGTQTTELGL